MVSHSVQLETCVRALAPDSDAACPASKERNELGRQEQFAGDHEDGSLREGAILRFCVLLWKLSILIFSIIFPDASP